MRIMNFAAFFVIGFSCVVATSFARSEELFDPSVATLLTERRYEAAAKHFDAQAESVDDVAKKQRYRILAASTLYLAGNKEAYDRQIQQLEKEYGTSAEQDFRDFAIVRLKETSGEDAGDVHAEYADFLQNYPGSDYAPEALYRQAIACRKLKDPDGEMTVLKKLTSGADTEYKDIGMYRIAWLHRAARKHAEALPILKSLYESGASKAVPEVDRSYIHSLLDQRQHTKAEQVADEVLRRSPDHPQYSEIVGLYLKTLSMQRTNWDVVRRKIAAISETNPKAELLVLYHTAFALHEQSKNPNIAGAEKFDELCRSLLESFIDKTTGNVAAQANEYAPEEWIRKSRITAFRILGDFGSAASEGEEMVNQYLAKGSYTWYYESFRLIEAYLREQAPQYEPAKKVLLSMLTTSPLKGEEASSEEAKRMAITAVQNYLQKSGIQDEALLQMITASTPSSAAGKP